MHKLRYSIKRTLCVSCSDKKSRQASLAMKLNTYGICFILILAGQSSCQFFAVEDHFEEYFIASSEQLAVDAVSAEQAKQLCAEHNASLMKLWRKPVIDSVDLYLNYFSFECKSYCSCLFSCLPDTSDSLFIGVNRRPKSRKAVHKPTVKIFEQDHLPFCVAPITTNFKKM